MSNQYKTTIEIVRYLSEKDKLSGCWQHKISPAQLQADFLDSGLTQREIIALKQRMGISGSVRTLANIGLNLKISPRRVQQILAMAIDKLLAYYKINNILVGVLKRKMNASYWD